MSAEHDFFAAADDHGEVPPPPFRHGWLLGPLVWIFVVGNALTAFITMFAEYVDARVALPTPVVLGTMVVASVVVVVGTRRRRRHTRQGLMLVAGALSVTMLTPCGLFNYDRTGGEDNPFLALPPFGFWNHPLPPTPPNPGPPAATLVPTTTPTTTTPTTTPAPTKPKPKPAPPPAPPTHELGPLASFPYGAESDCAGEVRDDDGIAWLVATGDGCDWKATIDDEERCGHERGERIVFDDSDVVVTLQTRGPRRDVGDADIDRTTRPALLRVTRAQTAPVSRDVAITTFCRR